MKGTEKIIAHIQAEAKAQADEILKFATGRTDDIEKEYRQKAQETLDEMVSADVRDSEDRLESMNRIAQMEAKKKILTLKQEMVGQCFDRALELIKKLPANEYKELLTRLITESCTTGDEEIILSADDRAAFGEEVVAAANAKANGHMTLSGRTGDFSGGVILRRGNIEVNSTFEQLIGTARAEMAPEIAKALFG